MKNTYYGPKTFPLALCNEIVSKFKLFFEKSAQLCLSLPIPLLSFYNCRIHYIIVYFYSLLFSYIVLHDSPYKSIFWLHWFIQSKNRVFCWNYSPTTTSLVLIFHKIRKQSSVILLISWVVQFHWNVRMLSFIFWTRSSELKSFTRHSNALDQLKVCVWVSFFSNQHTLIISNRSAR